MRHVILVALIACVLANTGKIRYSIENMDSDRIIYDNIEYTCFQSADYLSPPFSARIQRVGSDEAWPLPTVDPVCDDRTVNTIALDHIKTIPRDGITFVELCLWKGGSNPTCTEFRLLRSPSLFASLFMGNIVLIVMLCTPCCMCGAPLCSFGLFHYVFTLFGLFGVPGVNQMIAKHQAVGRADEPEPDVISPSAPLL